MGTGYDHKDIAVFEYLVPRISQFRRQRLGRFDGIGEFIQNENGTAAAHCFGNLLE